MTKTRIKLTPLVLVLLLFVSSTTMAQPSTTNIRPKILRIVKKLKMDNEVHFGYPVGYAGKPETHNKYFKLYKRLKNKATNEELLELAKDSSPITIVYAFNILYLCNYKGLKNIFLNYLNDSAWFWIASGCTGVMNQVNSFMLQRLKPKEQKDSKNYLTPTEYNYYYKKLTNEKKEGMEIQ